MTDNFVCKTCGWMVDTPEHTEGCVVGRKARLTVIHGGKGDEGHRPEGVDDRNIESVRVAARNLAEARTLFAQTFLLAKASAPRDKPITDRLAHELATEATKDEQTVMQAELEIALHLMRTKNAG